MNGGICVDGVNTYNCQCAPEWTGIQQLIIVYNKKKCLILGITLL